MRNSATHAKQVRKLYRKLKRSGLRASWPECRNILEHLMVAVLSENGSPTRAKTALNRLVAAMVDLNDLRVSTANELARIVEDDLLDPLDRAAALVRVLNSIYEKENAVTLDAANSLGKRDTQAYLNELDGVTPYVTGCTMLWGLNQHVIPLDEKMFAALKKDEVIDPSASLEETQSFLQRQIPASDAKSFVLLLKRYAATKVPKAAVATSK